MHASIGDGRGEERVDPSRDRKRLEEVFDRLREGRPWSSTANGSIPPSAPSNAEVLDEFRKGRLAADQHSTCVPTPFCDLARGQDGYRYQAHGLKWYPNLQGDRTKIRQSTQRTRVTVPSSLHTTELASLCRRQARRDSWHLVLPDGYTSARRHLAAACV